MGKNSFNRDIVALLLVSIMLGSLLAGGVSLGANSYFSKTLASLVGDYGEYDILIQSREEMKEDTGLHIQKILDEVFPGARMKEGPTITGKTSFFIAVPAQYRNKQTYEDLGKIFGGIPGGAGVGILTEPRLTIRGVPEGAKTMLIENIDKMDGVSFAFHDGAAVGVVLSSLEKSAVVNEEIKNLLSQYQVVEISFPVGSEPQNPIRMGEDIAQKMQTELRLPYAQNVSVDGKNEDMTYMVSTMMELKRFLLAYATRVTIVPSGGETLNKGDIVAFASDMGVPLVSGEAIDKNNVLVQITQLQADSTAEGTIVQSDAVHLKSVQGYKVTDNKVGSYVGTATYRNPRQELTGALTETSKVVDQIPGFTRDANQMSQIATSSLNYYGQSLDAINQTLGSLQNAGATIQKATSGLATIDTSALQNQVDTSSKAMGGLVNTLQVFKLLNGDVGTTIESVSSAQRNLDNLKSGLSAMDHIATDARQAEHAIDNVVQNGQIAMTTLQKFDVANAQNTLRSTNQGLSKLGQLNVPLISTQLQYAAASAPSLTDEEINHSVKLLDKFIEGQVIPGERIQILTTSAVSTEAITPIVYNQVGHNQVSLYASAMGVIEPNPRGELYSVLNQVRAILAGMTALIVTILLLALDHTAIMTVMRQNRQRATTFYSPERVYGFVVGAILLTAMFVLARGGIPYVPWICVPLIGGIVGLVVSCYTQRISPIPADEIMAGQSLGLSFDQIMREIVIPSGRPGLLHTMNQRKVKLK